MAAELAPPEGGGNSAHCGKRQMQPSTRADCGVNRDGHRHRRARICCWTAAPIRPMLACDANVRLPTVVTLTLAGCVPRAAASACRRMLCGALYDPTACCWTASPVMLTCRQRASSAACLPAVKTRTLSNCVPVAPPTATARRLHQGGCGAHSATLLQVAGPRCCRSFQRAGQFTVRRAS